MEATTVSSQPSQPQFTGARPYKSRRNRPCDFCRARKAACNIETQPPCQLCRQKSKPCTFVNGPGSRRRPPRPTSILPEHADDDPLPPQDGQEDSSPISPGHDLMYQELGFSFDAIESLPVDFGGDLPMTETSPRFHLQPGSLLDLDGNTWMDVIPESHQTQFPPSGVSVRASLETQLSTYRFVGPSGELDTHLLARRRYNDMQQSNSPYTAVLYQRTGPMFPDENEFHPPSVFTISKTPDQGKLLPGRGLKPLGEHRMHFKSLISSDFARGLIRLSYRFINPTFPVLSGHQEPLSDESLDHMPLSLLAATCASALPFTIYDDVLCVQELHPTLASKLWSIAWAALQLEPDVRLATVQASLLVLQRQVRDDFFTDASFDWRLCSMVLANCQTIGLNRDPSSWTILPSWEQKLRRRLWWAAVITESWTSFGQGMPSHLNMEDADVSLLGVDDLNEDGYDENYRNDKPKESRFHHLILLTLILRDIYRAFFTVSAMKKTTGDFQLALETAKPFRARLKQWQDDLPPKLQLSGNESVHLRGHGPDELYSTGPLRLAYITTQVTLFRALLRPLATALITTQNLFEAPTFLESDASVAVVRGAVGCAKELVKFIEGLTTADWDSFWFTWSKHNFAIASTFLMHLLVITQPSQMGFIEGCSPQQHHSQGPTNGSFINSPPSVGSPGSRNNNTNHVFTAEYMELQDLTKRWRWALRLAERGAGGRKGLMSSSLRRVEALFTEWQIGRQDIRRDQRAN